MKRKLFILVIGIALILFSNVDYKLFAERQAINIKDEVLKKQILSSLKNKNEKHRSMENIKLSNPDYVKPADEDKIYIDELELFTHFRSDEMIENIDDLKYMKNLKVLKIFRNSSITDISSLKNLTNLSHIWLDKNKISDVSALKDLRNIEVLRMSNNNISDISVLEEMFNNSPKLNKVYLYENSIKDFSPLKNVKFKVSTDFIGYNQKINIKPDSNKFFLELKDKNGKVYDLSDKNVTLEDDTHLQKNSDGSYSFKKKPENITFRIYSDDEKQQPTWIVNIDASNMNNNPNRKKVEFKSKELEDEILDILKNKERREDSSNITSDGFKDIELIDNSYIKDKDETFVYEDEMEMFKHLRVVYKDKLNYLDGLDKAINLESLKLSNNDILDITPISKLKKLKILNLDSNKNLADISSISELNNLENLSIMDASVGYLGALRELKNLKVLTLDSNNIDSVEPLKDLVNLTTLHLNDNQISDISPLSNLLKIKSLSIKNNQVRDVSYLKNYKNVTYLGLSNNMISDFSPLKGIFFEIAKVFPHENQIINIVPNKDEFEIILKDEYGKNYSIDSKKLVSKGDYKYSYAGKFEKLGFEVTDDYYKKSGNKNKRAWIINIDPEILITTKKEEHEKDFLQTKKENLKLKEQVKILNEQIVNLKEGIEELKENKIYHYDYNFEDYHNRENTQKRLDEYKEKVKNLEFKINELKNKTTKDTNKINNVNSRRLAKQVFYVGRNDFLNDGKAFIMDATPYLKNDRIMLPIRYLCESIGASVNFNDNTQMLIIQKDGKFILIKKNSNVAYLSDGEIIKLDVNAEIKNDRLFLPLSNINNLFSSKVKITWNEVEKSITVN